METERKRTLPREISDEELVALDIESTKCTTCTPCCMDHIHFLHEGKVIWACQAKLKRRDERHSR